MQSSYNDCRLHSFFPSRSWTPLSAPANGIRFHKRSFSRNYAEVQQQIRLAATETNLAPVKNKHEIILSTNFNTKENLKEYVSQLHHNVLEINPEVYAHLLKSCGELKELSVGQLVHCYIVASGLGEETFLWNLLIQMYDKCNALQQARVVFDQMPERTVFSWNSIISAYANHNHGREALMLFNQMQDIGQEPNEVTIITALNVCANEGTLCEGRLLHLCSIAYGLEPDLVVGTTLVKMYSRCKCLDDSERAFNKLHKLDVVAWNCMIGIYAKQRLPENALNTYKQMQKKNMSPDFITFLLLLESCGKLADISEGRFIHVGVLQAGVDGSVNVGNALISMYSKCGNLEDAQIEFNKMHVYDVVSWNTIIATYTQHGLGQDAIALYKEMTALGFEPNDFTFSTVISACADVAAFDDGSRIHASIVDQGLEYDMVVATALIDMYKNCNCLENARTVFHKIQPLTVQVGTAMIGAYIQHGKGNEALELFKQMLQDGLEPDAITFQMLLELLLVLLI